MANLPVKPELLKHFFKMYLVGIKKKAYVLVNNVYMHKEFSSFLL